MSSFQAMFLRLVSGSVAKNLLDAQIKCQAVRSSAPHEIEDWHWTQTVQVDWQWLSTLNTDLGRSSVRWCWQSITHIYALHIQRPLFLFQNLWHHAHWDTRNHACLKCLGCAACKATREKHANLPFVSMDGRSPTSPGNMIPTFHSVSKEV